MFFCPSVRGFVAKNSIKKRKTSVKCVAERRRGLKSLEKAAIFIYIILYYTGVTP